MTTQEISKRLIEIENEIQKLGNEYTKLVRKQVTNNDDVDKKESMYRLSKKALDFLEDRISAHELKLLEIYGVLFVTQKIIRHALGVITTTSEIQQIEKLATDITIKMITEVKN